MPLKLLKKLGEFSYFALDFFEDRLLLLETAKDEIKKCLNLLKLLLIVESKSITESKKYPILAKELGLDIKT